ncbi:MAG TPA: hypothetical protein VFV52_08435 [Bacilli bacterium]|nr:hypothetical protein [Bacilli bacterium]
MAYEKVIQTYEEIEGVRWVRNVDIPTGPHSSILLGGRVCTAVIRKPNQYTEYSVWGIHIATDDELTFIQKADDKPVLIKLVDCRKDSPTLQNYLEIETMPDSGKRLVIPRGVAHLPSFHALILFSAGHAERAIQALGFTLLREAKPGALTGFEKTLEFKFDELVNNQAD